MSGPDHRDIVIEQLAADEIEIREQLRASRELLSCALTRLYELQAAAARSQERIQRLAEETRQLREALFSLDRHIPVEPAA